MLFVAVLIAATAAPQFLNITPAHADDGGYPWSGALCAWTGLATGSCTNYDWGYTTCPSGDSYCTPGNQIKGYYQLDDWGYGFRNCTSYAAWRINQTFNVSNITGWGNAATWNTGYTSPQPYAVYSPSNYTPQIGDIAQWGSEVAGGFGHVAYVWNISTVNGVTIADLWDYNQAGTGLFSSSNTTASSSENTPDHYIHVGTVASNPGLGGGNGSSFVANRVDAWIEQSAPSNGSNLGHVWSQNNSWNPWETIPASNEEMTSQPAVVSWNASRIDVFARGQAGDLIHTWTDNPNDINAWNPWESLGGCIIGSPTVTSYGVGRLDVFAEGCNPTGGNLWHTWYDTSIDPNHWQPWENIETSLVMTAPPSAVSWAPGRIDIFARGTDSSLMHTFYDGAWESVLSLGGCIQGSPAASAWAPQRLDVFVEGCNATGGNFYHTFWDGQWNPYDLVNSSYQVSGVLGAVSWGPQRIDMFTRRSDNTLDHWWHDVNGWNGPDNRGGSLAA